MPSVRQAHPIVSLSVAVLVAALGAGCLSTRHVARPSTPQDLGNAVAAAGGPVTLLEGPPASSPTTDTTREVRPVAIKPEGIWVASGTQPPRLLEVKDLRGFEVRRRGRGLLQGLGIGLLTGAAAGATLGYWSHDDFLNDRGTNALYGGLVFGAIGGLTGALFGALAGSSDLYLFDPPR